MIAFVLFWHPTEDTPRWRRWMRYCHVSAILHFDGLWLEFDPSHDGTAWQWVAPFELHAFLTDRCARADVVSWIPASRRRAAFGWPLCCTSAVASAINAPGALWPTALHKKLLREGGQEIQHEEPQALRGAAEAAGRGSRAREG